MAAVRPPLSRDRIVAAAVELADAEGIAAVTMRRLSQELDVTAMALYKHVANKDDLLTGMVDAVVDEMAVRRPGSAARWPEELSAALRRARAVVVAHPWARPAIESRRVRTASVLDHMENVAAIFRGAGLTADLTHHVMHLLGNRIWGFSPELFTDDGGAAASGAGGGRVPEPGDYPTILAIAADAQQRRPGASSCDEEFELTFALDVLINGIERLHATDWQSPGGIAEVGTQVGGS